MHSVILRQVIKHLPNNQQENVTVYRPNPKLVNRTGIHETENKLVGFALLCHEPLIPAELSLQKRHRQHQSHRCLYRDQDPRWLRVLGPDSSLALCGYVLNRLRTLLPPEKRHVVNMPLSQIMTVGGWYSYFLRETERSIFALWVGRRTLETRAR